MCVYYLVTKKEILVPEGQLLIFNNFSGTTGYHSSSAYTSERASYNGGSMRRRSKSSSSSSSSDEEKESRRYKIKCKVKYKS